MELLASEVDEIVCLNIRSGPFFAVADALEDIPLTLASNAGMDPIDTQVDLRAAHSKGKTWAGINISDAR